MGDKVRKILIIVISILIALTLVFIHGNSCLSASQSSKTSGRVYNFFNKILPFIFNENFINANVIRKLAHFSEFFILGLEVSLLFILLNKFKGKEILLVLLIGIIDASIDETLQIFFERGASVIDVFIDFSGFALSTFITWTIYYLKRRIKR